MRNNIPTFYILKLDSSVVKSAKISTILCLFVQKIKRGFYMHVFLVICIYAQNNSRLYLNACDD